MSQPLTPPLSFEQSWRRAVVLVAAGLALLLAYAHFRPGLAYPLAGLWCGVGLALIAGLLAVLSLQAGARPLGVFRPALPLALFVAWSAIRTLSSAVPTDGTTELATFAIGLVLFWIGGMLAPLWVRLFPCARDRESFPGRTLRIGLVAFFWILGAAFALHAILEYHILYPAKLRLMEAEGVFLASDAISEGIAFALRLRRVGSQFGNPNVLCGFLAMCATMILAATGERHARKSVRIMGCVTLGAIAIAAWRTGSMGGMLSMAFGVALVMLGIIYRLKWSRQAVRAGLAIGMLALLWSGSFVLMSDRAMAAQSSEPRQLRTLRQRIYYLQSARAMWREAPLAGHGLGAYGRLYGRERIPGASETKYAHNFLAQLLVETGAVGLLLFGGFLACVAARFIATMRRHRPDLLYYGAGCAALVFLFHSMGDYTFHVREVYLDFCLLAGILSASPAAAPQAPRRPLIPAAIGGFSATVALAVLAGIFVPGQLALRDERWVRDILQAAASIEQSESPDREELRHLIDLSRDFADRALRLQPRNPRLWQMRAHIRARQGDLAGAVEDLRRAVAIDPFSASMRAERADYLWQQGRRGEALALVEEAIALYPLRSAHHVQRARYLSSLGRPLQAEEAAREALRVAFDARERQRAEKFLDALHDEGWVILH